MIVPTRAQKAISGLKAQFMAYPESCPGLWSPHPTSLESDQRLNLQPQAKRCGDETPSLAPPFFSHARNAQTGLKAWILLPIACKYLWRG